MQTLEVVPGVTLESVKGSIKHIRCEACAVDVVPQFELPNFGHECPAGTDLLAEVGYQLDYGVILCECGHATIPGLGQVHSC